MGNRKLSHASDRGTPAKVATTAINVSSDGSINSASAPNTAEVPASDLAASRSTKSTATIPSVAPALSQPQADSKPNSSSQQTGNQGFFSWISRKGNPGATDSTAALTEQSISPSERNTEDEILHKTVDNAVARSPATSPRMEQSDSRRSWFGMWPYAQASPVNEHRKTETVSLSPHESSPPEAVTSTEETSGNDSTPDVFSPAKNPAGGGKSTGWAFWSRERSANASSTSLSQEVGQLAVTNTPSQQHPRRASIRIEDRKSASAPEARADNEDAKVTGERPPLRSRPNAAQKNLQSNIPNLVLPSFQDTYKAQENLSMMRQLARYFNLYKPLTTNKIHRLPEPARVRKCLAVGVHGYFPAPLIRTVLGQPTGTSIKFANCAAHAIRSWSNQHGYDCSIEKIALEGEGRIAERVDVLWKLLLNWIEEIRQADFILLACHSQGVPVTIMLVEKLLNFGCVSSARIGICAMAGVNMGPFMEYRSRWISGSAGELFEFSNPLSKVSQDFRRSLAFVLESSVRIVLAGSIDDQLVSLEVSNNLAWREEFDRPLTAF